MILSQLWSRYEIVVSSFPQTFVQQKKRIHAAPILEDVVPLSEAKLEKSILPETAAEFDPEAGKPGMTAVSRPRGHRKTLKQRNFVLYGGLNVSEPEEGEGLNPYSVECVQLFHFLATSNHMNSHVETDRFKRKPQFDGEALSFK